jgi:hypothetical protein
LYSDDEIRALYGCSESPPATRLFRLGCWSIELRGGRFGPIKVNGHEVWHGVAFLLRDSGWATPEPVFESIEQHSGPTGDGVMLSGRIPCGPEDIAESPDIDAHVKLKLTLCVSAMGNLVVQAQAQPNFSLKVNRCGWVVLHSIDLVGRPIEIEHLDGRASHSVWPSQVMPWPLFTNVIGVRHEYYPGYWAKVTFQEEAYEVEDQRNNTDDSYKTYSRSNLMPRPFLLPKDEILVRSLQFNLCDAAAPQKVEKTKRRPCVPKAHTNTLKLGVELPTLITVEAEKELVKVVRVCSPSFLYVRFGKRGEEPNWSAVGRVASAVQCPVWLELDSEARGRGRWLHEAEYRDLAQRLKDAGIAAKAITVFPCGPKRAKFLRKHFPGAAVGGGTPYFFAQLNRLECTGGEDFMSFAVCPIVHDAGDQNVVNSLRSLPSMIRTAKLRYPGKDWHLGQSGLSAQFSPLGPQPLGRGDVRKALTPLDPREQSLFGSVWLVGHMAAAIQAAVASLSILGFDQTGNFGKFSSLGLVYSPAFFWLKICMNWKFLQCLDWEDAGGKDVEEAVFPGWPLVAIAGLGETGWEIIIANLSAFGEELIWPFKGNYSVLDTKTWLSYQNLEMTSPWSNSVPAKNTLSLAPYALAFINEIKI